MKSNRAQSNENVKQKDKRNEMSVLRLKWKEARAITHTILIEKFPFNANERRAELNSNTRMKIY